MIMISRGKRKGILPTFLPTLISLILIASFVVLPTQAAEPSQPRLQSATMRQTHQQQPPVVDGHGTGFMPPQVDLSHLTGQQMPEGLMSAKLPINQPPESFDWRNTDKVTSVKDQGACGSCYAFASIANIESKMLINGAATLPDPDYSENNAKECNYWETATIDGGNSCSGGNFLVMANWFSKKGTVLESCDPYVASDVTCNATCTYKKTLLDWRIICDDVVPDTNVLKNYIQNYGPVYTSMYATFPGFGSYDGSYTLYYTGTETPNHAVLIVGWDDSLSHPGGSGGWIVKNSWGTTWGEGGYFTIAYGSASIGKYSSFIYDWQDYDNNGHVMYYDECGWTTMWGESGGGNTTCWGLCKFIPSTDTCVTRVEFWTTDVTTDIDVYIYDDFDGTNLSNLLASKLNNSFNEAGYHSAELNTPLPVTAGDDVITVVKFTNSSYGFPLAADNKGPSETGRTYISITGPGDSWIDLGAYDADDVAIRLRTSAALLPIPSVITNDASNITTNSATLNGNLDSLGDYSSVDVSFEWGAISGALNQETTPETKVEPGAFGAQISGMASDTTYYFRAKATGSITVYGDELSFTTESQLPPIPPTLISPTTGSTVSNLISRLDWDASTGATSYGVQIATDSTFTSLIINQSGIASTYFDVPSGELDYDTLYYWRASASNAAGTSTWSSYWRFRTPREPQESHEWCFSAAGFFPKHLPDVYTGEVMLAGLDSATIPDCIQGVWWYDDYAGEWIFWVPEVGGDLTTLKGGLEADYSVLVSGACDWTIPLP